MKGTWPMFFNGVIEETDTIQIDVTNFDNFIARFYNHCSFVPLWNVPYEKVYRMIFGVLDQQLYYDVNTLSQTLYSFVEPVKHTVIINLKSGEKIRMSYCNITGIFYKPPKENYKTYMDNSIGFNESEKITDMVIPVSIINALPKQKIVFTY